MKTVRIFLILFILFPVPVPLFSYADVPESQKPEVEHLLEFVKNSGCKFERNGKLHDGERASRHIRDKYEYFIDEITSTETFIEYAATKSMISGKYYLVLCGDSGPVKTADWLLIELKNYRENGNLN